MRLMLCHRCLKVTPRDKLEPKRHKKQNHYSLACPCGSMTFMDGVNLLHIPVMDKADENDR